MSKSLQIPSFIKNKAGGKVLHLIYIMLNIIYTVFFLIESIHTKQDTIFLSIRT